MYPLAANEAECFSIRREGKAADFLAAQIGPVTSLRESDAAHEFGEARVGVKRIRDGIRFEIGDIE